jgi:hypothetical protein
MKALAIVGGNIIQQDVGGAFMAAWQVPAWFVDPVAGNDAANGTAALTPVQHYAEIVRRWGTIAPLLYQDTTITFLSDQPDLSDPVMLLGGNAGVAVTTGVVITGALTAQGPASTFTAVTVRNRGTDTRWTFTDASKAEGWAAAFVGYLVHDTTADAWFWIEASLPGRRAQVSEPLASAVGNPVPAYVPIANGDGYQIFAPRRVNVVRFSPSSASGSAAELRHLWLFNAGGAFDSEGNTLLTECRAQPFYTAANGVNLANSYLFGLNTPTGYIAGGVITNILTMPAGGGELVIDGDCLVNAPALGALGTIVVGAARFEAALDVPELNNAGAGVAALYVSSGALYGTAAFWGPSAIDCHVGGDVGWVGGTATVTFLNLGGLTLDGAGVASSYNLATGLWAPGIALTPANLDAATPGGFGGVAYGVKGSKIRQIS